MFLEIILLSFVIALLRGGSLQANSGLKLMWLAPLAFFLQIGNYLLPPSLFQVLVTYASYGLLLYFALINLNNQGVRLIMVGMLLNLLVITVNGGRIPVDLEAARSIGVEVEELVGTVSAKHEPLSSESYLPFLADVIPLPFPFPRIVSVGDLFAVVGTFFLVQHLFGKPVLVFQSGEDKA